MFRPESARPDEPNAPTATPSHGRGAGGTGLWGQDPDAGRARHAADASFEALKAHEELCGQVITLSTTAIGSTVTFLDKFRVSAADAPLRGPALIVWAWLAFTAAIVFGIWTIMAIAGSIARLESGVEHSRRDNVRVPAILVLAAFVLAIGLMVGTGRELIG